jgi:hypothetical protein
MKSHEHFQRRINRSINAMEAKISYLHQGVNGLSEALRDFQTEISDFMMFTAENYADHEKRISNLEKKIS